MASISRVDTIQILSSTIKDNDNFLSNLKILSDGCDEIEAFQHEYDYKEDLPGNGFRSFVKCVNKYFDRLHQAVGKKQLTSNLLPDYVTMAATLRKALKMLMMVRRGGVTFDPTEMRDLDLDFFTDLFNIEESEVAPLLRSPMTFFTQKAGMDVFLRTMLFILHVSFGSAWEKVKMICSPSHANNVIAHKLISMDMMTAQSMTPKGKYMLGVRMLNCLETHGTTVDRIDAECCNKWLLTVPDPSSPAVLLFVNERTTMTSSVLIKPNNMEKDNKKILMYIHGGGFISVNAQMVTGLMARTAKMIKVPIIIAEYRKVPDHRYPAALQDVLDLYMLLTSDESEMQQRIGFVPEEITLCGDSAGGTLSLSLTLTLNHLRQKGVDVRMPKSIAIQYPCAVPAFVAVPSFALLPFDPILSPGFVGIAASFLAPLHPRLMDDQWYRKKDGTVQRTITRLAPRLKDPLFNLLAFPDYHDLKDIPLFILACEMDPLLDHSILLAKKWRGEVKLDIVPDACHGYIAFYLHPGLQKERSVYEGHLIQAVSYTPTTENNNG